MDHVDVLCGSGFGHLLVYHATVAEYVRSYQKKDPLTPPWSCRLPNGRL
jgi:hypothetical protein